MADCSDFELNFYISGTYVEYNETEYLQTHDVFVR